MPLVRCWWSRLWSSIAGHSPFSPPKKLHLLSTFMVHFRAYLIIWESNKHQLTKKRDLNGREDDDERFPSDMAKIHFRHENGHKSPSPNHSAQSKHKDLFWDLKILEDYFWFTKHHDIFVCGNCLLTCCAQFMIGKALLAMVLSIHLPKTTAWMFPLSQCFLCPTQDTNRFCGNTPTCSM